MPAARARARRWNLNEVNERAIAQLGPKEQKGEKRKKRSFSSSRTEWLAEWVIEPLKRRRRRHFALFPPVVFLEIPVQISLQRQNGISKYRVVVQGTFRGRCAFWCGGVALKSGPRQACARKSLRREEDSRRRTSDKINGKRGNRPFCAQIGKKRFVQPEAGRRCARQVANPALRRRRGRRAAIIAISPSGRQNERLVHCTHLVLGPPRRV